MRVINCSDVPKDQAGTLAGNPVKPIGPGIEAALEYNEYVDEINARNPIVLQDGHTDRLRKCRRSIWLCRLSEGNQRPNYPEYQGMIEWRGAGFDTAAFEINVTNKILIAIRL